MPSFLNNTFSSFFNRILQFGHSGNTGTPTSLSNIQSGDGVNSALSLSDDVLQVQPQNDDGNTLLVKTQGGDNILAVDTTNSKVLVGSGQVAANTQYATFGVNYSSISNLAANTHYPIAFVSSGATIFTDVDFGTGTDPDDTFTTADTDTQYAAQIVPMMWFVPDNITIDAVSHIEGADAATGDTTRMHLKSFTFTSGSTSCLTSGALLAHNSDVTNAGNEQAYLSTWTVDSASVTANKVILCFFRSDSVNSDYSVTVFVKYHLT